MYDKYGKGGLKEGVPGRGGKFASGYQFQGDAFEIFEQFFGSKNPYVQAQGEKAGPLTIYLDGQEYIEAAEDITVTLECSLYEFYNGC